MSALSTNFLSISHWKKTQVNNAEHTDCIYILSMSSKWQPALKTVVMVLCTHETKFAYTLESPVGGHP